MNGDPIALPGMPKPAARMSFTTSVQGKIPESDQAAKGGKGKTADSDEEATSDSTDSSDESSGDSDSGSSESSSDSSLDDLLASLGDDSGSSADSSDAATADVPAADGEMDPDLAELLKSLE
jgi:hypothetical protein